MQDCVPSRCIYTSGDSIDRKYKVLQRLGEGTFGAVYKIEDADGQTYALKLLKLWEVAPQDRQVLIKRFDMEFETGRIASPYLVHSYSHDSIEGNPYIVMEFCPKGDLRSREVSADDLVRVGTHVLYGLRDLHRCGKIHRDLKPDNVLFRYDETAVLTDFGISGDQNKRMTERGWLGRPKQIFGTYAYMPPEQARPPRGGQATVLPTTDIFSFGVMMYELLTGRLPFGDLRNEADLVPYLNNGRDGKWDRSTLKKKSRTVDWNRVIEGCLVPDFHQRLQGADEVLALLPGCERHADSFASSAMAHGNVLLRVMQGEEYGKVYVLDDLLAFGRSLLKVGRENDDFPNDIAIRETQSCYVSRKHCTLEKNRMTGCWYVRDGQWDRDSSQGWRHSLNGTYLNSQEITGVGTPLKEGDILSVGDVKLRVEIG